MSAPSSPSPSSGSDDFAALLDADLQTSSSPEELAEYSKEGTDEDVDVEEEDEEGTENLDELGVEADVEAGEDSLVEVEEQEKDDNDRGEEVEDADESENSKFSVEFGEYAPEGEQFDWHEKSGREKRKREQEEDEEDEAQNDANSAKGSCPPHPGFMWGVCIRCGQNREVSNSEPKPVAVALRYIHEGLELTENEAARMRRDELKHVMLKKKLYLVLDLDHTMLNSARFIEVHPEEEAHLAACYSPGPRDGEGGAAYINGLNRLDRLQMWTKLRPFAHKFIEAASKICEMYVYTMGERAYALAMVRLLDPDGRFFGDRIISQGDSTRSTMKDLDVVLGAESAVVILDDTEGVWPKHRANLILMERYHFFRSSCRQFQLRSLSLTEKARDESEKEGTLATALRTLHLIHDTVFNTANSLYVKLSNLGVSIFLSGISRTANDASGTLSEVSVGKNLVEEASLSDPNPVREGDSLKNLVVMHTEHSLTPDCSLRILNLIERGISKRTADYMDVRKVIQSLRGRILNGCTVVFSRIFPTGMPYPESHPFWRLTAELGAHCSTTITSATTHVIALDRGTDKARWAKQQGKLLVHPCWVEAAQYLWCRPREEDFPVGENNTLPPLTSFAKTVPVTQQIRQLIRPEIRPNGGVDNSHGQLPEAVESRADSVTKEVKLSPKKEEREVLDSAKVSSHLATPLSARTS